MAVGGSELVTKNIGYYFVFAALISCGQKDIDKRSSGSTTGIQPLPSHTDNINTDFQDAISKLSSANADTRMAGVMYLTKNATGNARNMEAVITALLPLLNEKNDAIRRKVVLFLLNSNSARWTPYALQLLNDTSSDIRKIAISHFMLHYGSGYKDRLKIGKTIRQILLDKKEDAEVRRVAALTYKQKVMVYEKWNDMDDIKERIRKESPSECKIIFNEYSESENDARLIDAMRNISSDNIEQKKNALRFLRERYHDIRAHDRTEIFKKIMADIDDKDDAIRIAAVGYLLNTMEPAVFEHSNQFLQDPSGIIRARAIDWIWTIYKNAAPLPEAKRQILIKHIDKPEVIEGITQIVVGDKDDELVRISACEVLMAMGRQDLLLKLKKENHDRRLHNIIEMAAKQAE